ncbi:hypothetical protein HMPREF1548_03964 [Clostridium sp. KLE 1755]|nr:hypothetical protein HMPREF1548_03964 [Clostridium sp. KLE 1755]
MPIRNVQGEDLRWTWVHLLCLIKEYKKTFLGGIKNGSKSSN